jgi:tetratricopeptide (TPR) repeat protein
MPCGDTRLRELPQDSLFDRLLQKDLVMKLPRLRIVRTVGNSWVFVAWSLCAFAGVTATAQAARHVAQERLFPDATPRIFGRGDFRVDIIERPEPLQPIRARTDVEQSRLDAVAWFMKGRFLESREEFKAALEAYEKAVELDPNAVEVYRALIPLAFGINEADTAIKYALKAVELSPDDHLLLQRVGIHLATKAPEKVPEAIKLLEQASRSKKLDRNSSQFVAVMRDLGFLYLMTGQIDKAADAFEVVLDAKIDPEKYHLDFQMRSELEKRQQTRFETIGQVFLEAKRPDRAIVALEHAAKANKTKPGIISFSLAQAYLMTDKPDKALDHLQTYFDAQLQSKGKGAYQLLAEILKAQDKSNGLIPRLENMAAKDPHNLTLQFFLAQQYIEANRLDDAEKLYKKTLDREKSVEGYLGLAALYRRQNRPAELLQSFSEGISRDTALLDWFVSSERMVPEPRFEKVAEDVLGELQAIGTDEKLFAGLLDVGSQQTEGESPKLDFAGSLLLAKVAAQVKQVEPAERFYRYALKQRRDRAAGIFEELGKLFLQARQFVDAAKVFQEAASDPKLDTAKPYFLFLRSQAEEMADNTDAALAAIADARGSNPNAALQQALDFQEGWVHYHAHNWDKAVPLLTEFIKKYPQHKLVKQCQFSLSNIHVQKGDIRKGEEILETVLAESPDDPSANNDLGYLYADQGKNLEQARGMIEKALKTEPDNAAYQDSMGWILFRLGKANEALPYLEKALSAPRGGDATIWDHLGDVHEQLGHKDKAAESWTKALKDAKEDKHPDEKLIEKLEGKLKR